MWARDLPIASPDDALRIIRALGKHRYVAGNAHFVHALAACDVPEAAWARDVLGDDAIDKTSRDERLVKRATEEEVYAVLSWFWSEDTAARAADALLDR